MSTDGSSDAPVSSDAMLAELLSLRKKYDAVVEYTVHLTAERDTIVAQLEEVQREYAKEKSRKKEALDGLNAQSKASERVVQTVSSVCHNHLVITHCTHSSNRGSHYWR
jgi:hypothetical protein